MQFIKTRAEDRGLAPRTVADRRHRDVADVHRALTYQHDHPEETCAVECQREESIGDHAHLTTDPEVVRG